MPKQYKLDLPKAALSPAKKTQASQKLTRLQALSNLRLIQKDMAKGNVLNDEAGVPRTAFVTRQSRAEYLDTAISDILAGVDATEALCLGKRKGQAKKEERDIVIAMVVDQLHAVGYSIEDAIGEAARQLNLPEDTVKTSRKKGQKIAAFIAQIQAQTDATGQRPYEPLIRLLQGSYLTGPDDA